MDGIRNGWHSAASVGLALAVCIGAFGAHGLKNTLDAYSMDIFEKAVFYHFLHALGLLHVSSLKGSLLSKSEKSRVCILLSCGILLFSGSLYALALFGNRALGAITPFGGLCFIAAWLLLARYSLRQSTV